MVSRSSKKFSPTILSKIYTECITRDHAFEPDVGTTVPCDLGHVRQGGNETEPKAKNRKSVNILKYSLLNLLENESL